MKLLKGLPFELFFWLTALVLLGTADLRDHREAAHFTLCPLASMGFTWCPGCGIGRAIGHLLQGDFGASLEQHWFGLPALVILCCRMVSLTRTRLKTHKVINLKYKEERYV